MCKQRKVQQPTDTSHLTKQNNSCKYQTLHGVCTGDLQVKQTEIFTVFNLPKDYGPCAKSP